MHPIIIGGLIACALALGGCAPEFRAAIAHKGASLSDQTLESAQWYVCRAASVGSVVRRYGQSAAKAEAWRTICRDDPITPVITGPLSAPLSVSQ